MTILSGVFTNLESAERACRQLEALGIAQSQLSLTFDENCPACSYEREQVSRDPSASVPMGQVLGALSGLIVGVLVVFWPLNGILVTDRAPADPVTLSLFDWMLRLFIVASWGLSGGILGGMLAAASADLWEMFQSRKVEKPLHSHYILRIDSAAAADTEIRQLLQKRGGRLIETPAPSRLS